MPEEPLDDLCTALGHANGMIARYRVGNLPERLMYHKLREDLQTALATLNELEGLKG